jgi:hypothetical protein
MKFKEDRPFGTPDPPSPDESKLPARESFCPKDSTGVR